jgi:Protein of unknown function (DUF2490)
MQGFTRFVLHLVSSSLVIGLVSRGAPCVAQEVDPPPGSGSVVAVTPWAVLTIPVQQRVNLKLYGFYIGNLDAPSAQVDVPIRAARFLTFTPSYLFYSIPASGLDDLANLPGAFSDSYNEHQFRIDGTVGFPLHKLELSLRNMYVRRFKPAPADDSDRYRVRFGIAHPVPVKGSIWKAFASYEAFYDWDGGGWDKDRIWVGVTLPLMRRVLFEPSYLWENSDAIKTINYLLFGLRLSTR